MRVLNGAFILSYLVISVLWVINSPYLFTLSGITIWIALILAGAFFYTIWNGLLLERRLLLVLGGWMVFLVLATLFIHLAQSSMP
ncbi:hypothetical protein SAMN05192559_11141 [Halobacillus karajensis]|uniref:Uncharacterized protein n=1 Tax=Halobacillus karajensis TaxID=195088 RepID=A0A024PAN1_9BACI|nr:hypothetical protein [Halobacillus karajensis]CDQ21558.1 hypothetical protein BN982_03960 [Halobacillus karajensis]CDQ25492.1 hypothetical protein BN983_03838 [Halobacillus karajensis]CDQ28977.1 hypothetical protein BN981_03321 [Halobacillus karajensis]SEI08984.1 hypothetical protein SAMN05192559_11141 [Halobacillus karajensis]